MNEKFTILLQAATLKPVLDHDVFLIIEFADVNPSLLLSALNNSKKCAVMLQSPEFANFIDKQIATDGKAMTNSIQFTCIEKLVNVIFK